MVKRIDRLTPEQAAQMPAHRDKWIKIGLSTAPMLDSDRHVVEQSIRFWYRRAGHKEPKAVIFVPSPFALRVAAGIAAGAIHVHRHGWPIRPDSAVRSAVDSAVRSAVDSAVRSAVGSAVGSAVRSAVRSAVDSAVDSAVRSAVDSGPYFLLRCAQAAYGPEWGGNFWCGWSAWQTYFRDVCGLEIEEMDAFARFEALQSRGGPFTLYADFAMVSDRPSVLKRDAGGRLHADNGPAIAWRDTWNLYYWHGQQIPRTHEWVVDQRGRLTPEAIEAEANVELRRIMLEVFGFENYLAQRQAKVIATDELHGQPRRLLEIAVAGEKLRVIEVNNGSLEPDGTRRKFHLGAARDPRRSTAAKTPHEAVAASYGIVSEHYREAVRT